VGSHNSSNSVRLVEVALKAGAKEARLIDDAGEVDWGWFEGRKVVGLTAGASAPESLFAGLVREIEARFEVEIEEDEAARETVTFKLPRVLSE
jgi:4-hydroxy-3-methylbut-2-enyl diphosphate reductase